MANNMIYHIIDNRKGRFVEIEGEPIDIGMEGLFVHKTYGWKEEDLVESWTVSEVTSGCCVTKGDYREDAISKATELILSVGQAHLRVRIEAVCAEEAHKKAREQPVIKLPMTLGRWLTV